ncbi:MAG: replication restart helicase PriA [Terriglobia bacterium]
MTRKRRSSEPLESFVQVAVMAAVRDPLTYRAPPSLDIRPGQRVLVPLGRRKAIGMTLEPRTGIAPGLEAREIIRVLDAEPILSPELLTLGLWIADYYVAPAGEVFRAMLPLEPETRVSRAVQLTEAGREQLARLNESLLSEITGSDETKLLAYVRDHPGVSSETVRRKFPGVRFSEAMKKRWITEERVERDRRKTMAVSLASGSLSELGGGRKLSPAARRILEALREQEAVFDHRELLKNSRATRASLDRLQREGLVTLQDARTASRAGKRAAEEAPELTSELEFPQFLNGAPCFDLTAGQSSALESLSASVGAGQFGVFLLHGVTGSGKTEIYMRLIAQTLRRGRSALLLVPEISLTPLLQSEFVRRFGEQVAVLHSGLRNAERQQAWWRVWRGEAKAVLGTRSAVFSPLANLGLVVVDEEHDDSYKQQETPRYHGRDVATVRARLSHAAVVLGSATPSLESYSNAQQGKYRLLTLDRRVAGRPLAAVEIIDMRREFRETHTQALISRRLHQEIESQLASGGQVMILLNHRGYAWFVLCRACGEAVRCLNCSITLTYHRREQRLICHYCGYTAALPEHCPVCGSEYLQYVGEGTEKIEDKLTELFPGARVERLDRDVAGRPGHYLRVLTDFREGRIQILAGTQMIAKGHDFPGVTLVGVISADMGLRLPDFRSAERTFQILTQAAGRAGRGESPGRVMVQTFYPEHYAIRLAADQNYPGFFSKEIGFRSLMHYPPKVALAKVIAQDERLDRAAQIASHAGRFLAAAADPQQVKILGPNPAPLARIERRYRVQILLKSRSRPHLNQLLRRMVDDCERSRIPLRSLVIDVDPVSMM